MRFERLGRRLAIAGAAVARRGRSGARARVHAPRAGAERRGCARAFAAG